MTFVRLAGCNLFCDYCDSCRFRSARKYPRVSSRKLIEMIKKISTRKIISFTGGEPLIYADFLREVFPEVKKLKKRIYLETNGTLPENFQKVKKWTDIVALDIKLPSATGQDFFNPAEKFLSLTSPRKVLVKIVLTPGTGFWEIKKSVEIIARVSRKIPLCFTPVSLRGKFFSDQKKINQFVDYARKFLADVRVIPQIHKFFSWR